MTTDLSKIHMHQTWIYTYKKRTDTNADLKRKIFYIFCIHMIFKKEAGFYCKLTEKLTEKLEIKFHALNLCL